MKTTLHGWRLIAFLAFILFGSGSLQAQLTYTPYAFTNFAGQPGGPGIANGLGQGARFSSPTATAVDAGGNVYVADSFNFTIRKITPAGEVTTIAGTPQQFGSSDGVGGGAKFGTAFGGPTGIAVDSTTNIYVADTGNYTIRKLVFNGTNWAVSTLAGKAGFSGAVDNTNSAARFTSPSGITTDAAGNIYLTDGFAIRRVTPAGAVATLAGSVTVSGSTDATNELARFGSALGGPKGIAVDGATNIYVADTYNSSIRRVTPSGTNWVVTTFAGTTGFLGYGFNDGTNETAQFANPWGITLDQAGHFYVSDGPAQTIRKIELVGTNRVVTTFAGKVVVFGSADGIGTNATFLTPEGLSADSAGNIYVAEFGNDTIRKLTPGAVVSTFAGQAGGIGLADGVGNAAQFDIPHSLAVDAAGNVYVGDTFNHTVRKIAPDGTVTTIAGSPHNKGFVDGVGTYQAAQFNSPIGIGADANGNLYLADNGNQTIRKVTPAGVATTVAGKVGVTGTATNANGNNATFNSPNSTAVDSLGNIFVSDLVNRVIRKIAPNGDVTLFAGSPSKQQNTNDGVGTLARFQAPEGLAIDKADNLYVADQGASTIRKIAPDGTVTTLAGKGKVSGTNDGVGSLARFSSPEAVAVDGGGNVYVSDTGNQTIRMITPAGVVTTLAGSPGQKGNVDATNAVARFNVPRGIAVDSATNIYVADSANSTIRKLVLQGTNCIVTTLAGGTAQNNNVDSVDATGTNAVFSFLYGLTVDSAGTLFAVDRSNDDIRKITPAGVVTTLAGVPGLAGSYDGSGAAAQFDGPEELAVDSATNIYVIEHFNNTVRKISPNGTNWVVTTIAGCPSCPAGTNDGSGLTARFNGPFGLTVDPSGNVYVADTGNRTIRKLTPAGADWNVSTFAGTPVAGPIDDGTGTNAHFASPLGLAADATGLYVADSSNIRKVTYDGAVTTLAGCISCVPTAVDGTGTNAIFWSARGVAVDQAGDLYVADSANDLVRKLTSDGTNWTVTTLGGVPGQASGRDGVGAEARFNQPTGIGVDANGNVYVINSGENNVVKGVPAGTVPVPLEFDTGSPFIVGGQFQIHLSGPSGTSAIVEASTNLVNWTPLLTNSLPLTLPVPTATTPHQFFRAHLVQ